MPSFLCQLTMQFRQTFSRPYAIMHRHFWPSTSKTEEEIPLSIHLPEFVSVTLLTERPLSSRKSLNSTSYRTRILFCVQTKLRTQRHLYIYIRKVGTFNLAFIYLLRLLALSSGTTLRTPLQFFKKQSLAPTENT